MKDIKHQFHFPLKPPTMTVVDSKQVLDLMCTDKRKVGHSVNKQLKP